MLLLPAVTMPVRAMIQVVVAKVCSLTLTVADLPQHPVAKSAKFFSVVRDSAILSEESLDFCNQLNIFPAQSSGKSKLKCLETVGAIS